MLGSPGFSHVLRVRPVPAWTGYQCCGLWGTVRFATGSLCLGRHKSGNDIIACSLLRT